MSASRSKHWVRGLALVAAFGAGPMVGSLPAQAQFSGFWGFLRSEPPPQLTLDALAKRLGGAGYRHLAIRMNGGVYLVDASDRSGKPVRLVVDVKDGTILQRFATLAPHMNAPDGGVASPGPGFAPSTGAPTQPALSGAKQRPQTPRVSPAPSAATVTPAAAPPEPLQQPPQAPVVATAPPAEQPPASAPVLVGPGYANGVPINPLD